MAKFNDIRELAQQNARWVSNSPKDWMNYLDVAARLYRYSFKDTLLIHAQRPDATACAELEVWNKKMQSAFQNFLAASCWKRKPHSARLWCLVFHVNSGLLRQ